MKYLLALVIIGFASWWWSLLPLTTNAPMPLSTPQPSAKTEGITVKLYNINYSIHMQEVRAGDMLTLIPNFTQKRTAAAIMETHGCTYGINGGFYTPNNKPLGKFYSSKVQHKHSPADPTFLNGFVLYRSGGLPMLIDAEPEGENYPYTYEFVFQTGPYIHPDQALQAANDKPARRMTIAKTSAGNIYFISVVEKENLNNGPYLSDLPEIFAHLRQILNIEFSRILNLDGGSASAMYTAAGVKLGELTPIGSFICGKI